MKKNYYMNFPAAASVNISVDLPHEVSTRSVS